MNQNCAEIQSVLQGPYLNKKKLAAKMYLTMKFKHFVSEGEELKSWFSEYKIATKLTNNPPN